MFKIDLPRAEGSMPLQDAIELMRERQCAGLVVDLRGRTALVEARDILRHLREQGNVCLGELRAVERVPITPRAAARPHRHARLGARQFPHVSFPETRMAFKPAKALVVNRLRRRDSFLVATKTEQLARHLSRSLVLCICQTVSTHIWEPGELLNPGACNKDGSPVRCS